MSFNDLCLCLLFVVGRRTPWFNFDTRSLADATRSHSSLSHGSLAILGRQTHDRRSCCPGVADASDFGWKGSRQDRPNKWNSRLVIRVWSFIIVLFFPTYLEYFTIYFNCMLFLISDHRKTRHSMHFLIGPVQSKRLRNPSAIDWHFKLCFSFLCYCLKLFIIIFKYFIFWNISAWKKYFYWRHRSLN